MNNVKKIIVWVSGWPDSMFLTFLLTNLFWKEKLIIAHYNHKFRKESDIEAKKLKEYFSEYTFCYEEYKWKNFSENILRRNRYDFFKKLWWWRYYLALWHNLTDRIETSFLSLLRWWGLKWFLNMKKVDHNKKILRPLLDIPKWEILQKCELYGIPYFIDKTNFDIKISKRNLIRNNVLSLLEKINYGFYYSFKNLYKQIESILPQFSIEDFLLPLENNFFLLKIPDKNIDFFLREVLEYFGELDFRWNFLKELEKYILDSGVKWWGFKKIWNIYFLKKEWKIFLWVWQDKDYLRILTKKYSWL